MDKIFSFESAYTNSRSDNYHGDSHTFLGTVFFKGEKFLNYIEKKMNAVSTPIRKSCSKCLTDPLSQVTPIKPFHHLDNDCESFDLDSSFETVNEKFVIGDGKRKFATVKKNSDLREKESLTGLSHVKKKKVNDPKTISANCSKNCNATDSLNQLGNTTPGADMFEDELLNEIMNASSKQKYNYNRINFNTGQISEDIIENSYLRNDNEICDKNMLVLSNKNFNENASMDAYGKTEAAKFEDFSNEDSFGLSVFLKGNGVVDSILGAMNLQDGSDQILNEISMPGKVLQNEFSEILTESVLNWDKDEMLNNTNDVGGIVLASKMKQRLLDNVNVLKTTKSETTGWSQMDDFTSFFDESIRQNSQFQELGPFFGLPSKVEKLYEEHKGIKDLYTWQKECLTLKAVKEKKNLVYSLPTSGGKTLVAEILILRELLCYNKNVLFILPFVSIVQEKVHDLSIFALELGFLVEEYAAGKGILPLRKRRKRRSVIIATIEKASAIAISLIEMKQLGEFGLVVVDELHLISEDSGRGSTLESLLTHILHLGEKVQIIGMTATIGNLHELAQFLKAETYIGSFRPVELKEFIKCGNDIFDVNWIADDTFQPVRSFKSPPIGSDPDGISNLVLEIIPKDAVLIFCPTKKNCENVALLIAEMMPSNLLHHKEEEKQSFLKALKSETNGQICPIMKKTIPYGVVYHHSGLTPGERKLLEEGFRTGTLIVICCTSTLAAGINLPAARVILRSPYIGKDFISLSKYKQMIGRAGRAGMGCAGESYLICQKTDSSKLQTLLRSKMDDAISKMNLDSLKSFVLSSIGLGTATTRDELRNLINCTLLAVQAKKLNIDIKKMVDSCLSSLFKMGAIKVREFDNQDVATTSKLDISLAKMESKSIRISNSSSLGISRLGRAAMKGCIGLERAHELYGDFIKAQASLVLLTELHLLYLVTPYEMIDRIRPNYSIYFDVYMQLTAKELPAAKVVGVTEFVISKLATGVKPKSISESVLNRFYIALILNEMLKQQNIWDVAKLFQVSPGMVQTLMTSTSTFANNVLRFCEELQELWSFKSLLKEFSPRLAHCCSIELLPLLELPAVKRGRAKQLYDAGYKTLQLIANADAQKMVKSVDHLPMRVAQQIIAAARLLLLEKAENLKEEAEEVLQGLAEKIILG